jgi:Fe-S-cluster containining protein
MLAELTAVYERAAAAFTGWSCPSSTECCHFGVTGREPYVTSIELAAIERAIAALGGLRALRSKGRAASTLPLVWSDAAARRCPLLGDDGRCRVYAARPLGCRTFFCGSALAGHAVRHREVSALVREVQELAARHQPEGDRGRPLTRALRLDVPRRRQNSRC